MKLLRKILRNEAGQALPMALVLLVLGGLLVGTSVSLMHTNLKANIMVDRKTSELYAADAGVEKVLWHIKYDGSFTLPEDDDDPQLIVEDLDLNGKTVDVYISKQAGQPYKITSTASDDGNSTTIECYISLLDFSWLFDSAITSPGAITLMPGTEVSGDVRFGEELDDKGEIDGEEIYDPDLADNWPTAEQLSSYYYDQVADLDNYDSSEISIDGPRTDPTSISRLYRNGNLLLKGGGWARLDSGPVYVTGTLNVNPTGDCVLDLNNQTVFSEYDNDCIGDAIYLGPKTILRGSGCVIAVGNIQFNPHLGTAGDKLIGVDYTTAFNTGAEAPEDTLLLSQFQADKTGYVETFSILTPPGAKKGNVKLAMYNSADPANPGGEPTTIMSSFPDGERSVTVSMPVTAGLNGSGLNDISFPKTYIEAGEYYWLAAICDTDEVIGYDESATWESRRMTGQSYSSFDFSDLTSQTLPEEDERYLLAGNALPFVFVMSIECESAISPGGTFYGAIAGNTEVYLAPGTSLTWPGAPEDGLLNFPGSGASDDSSDQTWIIDTYTIDP